jgi:hypothetical protein
MHQQCVNHLGLLGKDCLENILFTGEVSIERALTDIDCLSNIPGGGCPETSLSKQFGRCIHDGFALSRNAALTAGLFFDRNGLEHHGVDNLLLGGKKEGIIAELLFANRLFARI